MPGGGDPVRGGVRVTDDGRGTFLLGVAEGTGAVQGVRVGDGGWIYGRANEDTTWVIDRGYMELENLDHSGRTADTLHGLPGQGRPAEPPG